jgi:hypothetical protein
MRLVMKNPPNGSLGNFYCTVDVGTAVAMEELLATFYRLPEWLMQKYDFSPETNKSSAQTA